MTDKRYTLLLLASTIVWGLLAGCGDDSTTGADGNVNDTDFFAEEPFYYRVEMDTQVSLELEGVSGEISLIGVVGSDSVVISGVRRVRSESVADAEEHLELLEVEVEDLSARVVVKTVQPERSYGRSYEVDYDIVLPAGMRLNIDHVNGQILLNNLRESVYASLVNGLVDGEVTMPSGGVIDLAVVNGGIQLAIPKTTSAEFSAGVVNGSIGMTDLTLQDPVTTSTSLTGTLGSGDGAISLSVVNGNINVVGME